MMRRWSLVFGLVGILCLSVIALVRPVDLTRTGNPSSDVVGKSDKSQDQSVLTDGRMPLIQADPLGSAAILPAPAAATVHLQATYSKLPLHFEANQGQTDPQVKFLARGGGYSVFLTATEAVLALHKAAPPAQTDPSSLFSPLGAGVGEDGPAVLRMRLVGANPASPVIGLEQLTGQSNYFLGNDPTQWRTNIPTYARVEYREIYPGINLVYYGNQHELEYDFVVAPGADPKAVQLAFEGTDAMAVDGSGDLIVQIAGGELRLRKPLVYQEIDGSKRAIPTHYVLLPLPPGEGWGEGMHRFGFQVAAYDLTKPLIIDPVLSYSTYLRLASSTSIAVDNAGNAYVTGLTGSPNFPTTPSPGTPFQPSLGGGFSDAFATKLNTNASGGASLVYSTYLGGSGHDQGTRIAVDTTGNAYVTGFTFSTNFPTTSGAFQTHCEAPVGLGTSCTGDAFVTKLDPQGQALVYSTYLGGTGSAGDFGIGIAVDGLGNAYVTGNTHSTNFPTTAGAFRTACLPPEPLPPGPPQCSFGSDVFVTKLNPAGSALVYSTYLGGSASENVFGIAEHSGNAYVMGYTASSKFPTAGAAFQPSCAASSGPGTCAIDAYVAVVNGTGNGLVYSTYLGGTGFGLAGVVSGPGNSIAVDSSGNAYVIGRTSATNFPTQNAAQGTFGGGISDAFVAKLDPFAASGPDSLVYSTYLGGSDSDDGFGIAVDAAGNVYVTGNTLSTNFPTTAGALQTSCALPDGPFPGPGCVDAFVTKLNPAASGLDSLVYSSYLGGSSGDSASGIAVDVAGNAYVTGITGSLNFPTTANAYQSTASLGTGSFVAKITDQAPNQFPIANAGPDQTVHVGTSVTLDGSGSSDPDGNTPLAFAWTISAKPTGSTAALSDPAASMSSVTPDVLGDYTIQLIVTDSLGAASAPDTAVVSTANSAPVAAAGLDQAILQIGTVVQLDGTASFDPDGDSFTYFWSFVQKPPTSSASLSNPMLVNPIFVADVHGDYVISLVVTDIFGAGSDPDTVMVSFTNVPPVADTGDNQTVAVGGIVLLDGSGSFDANFDPLTYSWSFVAMPPSSAATLLNPSAVNPSFVADSPGMYIVSLVVNDGIVNSAPSNVTITATLSPAVVIQTLGEAISAINALDPDVFKNPNMKKALTNKLNAVIKDVDEGFYQEALDKLTNDILAKTNGCDQSGAPDANDWIRDCLAQAQVSSLLVQAIQQLMGLL